MFDNGRPAMQTFRQARLFRNGCNQALRIPREFELPGTEVRITRDGNRLIVEPVCGRNLRAVLAGLQPVDEAFPDVDAGLAPLDDVSL